MKSVGPRLLYLLLALYVAISLTYQIVASVSLIVGYFDLRRQVQEPFEIDFERPIVTSGTPTARQVGVARGDRIESINRVPYSGRAVWQRVRWYGHPGEVLHLIVQKKDGTHTSVSVPLTGYSGENHTGESIFVLFLHIAVPLSCLCLGFWVALARPKDPNAWLILILLSYPEAFISVSTYNWWPGFWLVLRLGWHLVLEAIAPLALLWLGLLFPERSRIDIRLPWLKWLFAALTAGGLAIGLLTDYTSWYDLGFIPNHKALDTVNNRLLNWTFAVCVVLYWVAIFDKLRTASTPDVKRRLRVLCIGSVIGLGSILVIWGALPGFGIADPGSIQWLGYLSALLMLAFPLSLAYVVVVQRALDVRILLRLGTKYALARGSIWTVRAALIIALLVLFWETARAPHAHLESLVRLALFVLLVFLVSPRMFDQISRWIDRRFFREAYNAELVLSDLSREVRLFTETAPLIETVCRRISEVLHVPEVAVLLRNSNVFQARYAMGLTALGPLLLPENSSTVRHILRSDRPATLYRDQPEEWFIDAGDMERNTLDTMQAELLLGLPGRDRLIGLIALGRKKSEEPYSPSDLRLLQSVGIQTGLALEVSELAHSLADEAAQRARISREIEIAREVQERLFPQRIPELPGLSLSGACRPAQGVGGDYYDVIELADGRLGLAIGDVSGKGISAALLMASLRASLRTITLMGEMHLAKLMNEMNQLVYESSGANRYATFFFAIYNPVTRTLNYVNAGHNPPALIRASNAGLVQCLRLETGGPVIGLLPDMRYQEESLTLQTGDVLLTYTDGISEAMTEDDEEWGEERMIAAAENARTRSAEEILKIVFAAADEFTADAPQHDDMTLLIMKLS